VLSVKVDGSNLKSVMVMVTAFPPPDALVGGAVVGVVPPPDEHALAKPSTRTKSAANGVAIEVFMRRSIPASD
jgi:hypothetical protein